MSSKLWRNVALAGVAAAGAAVWAVAPRTFNDKRRNSCPPFRRYGMPIVACMMRVLVGRLYRYR